VSVVGTTSIIGFDSAWTDNPRAPGAICTIRIERAGRRTLVPPRLASFDEARAAIEAESAISDLRLVALDQPTLVPNATGMRPVDRVAASLIS
jgi:predicted RNase H-like nuclease